MKQGGSANITLGARGEALAIAYLKGKRFRICEQNFRCKGGEVDIIAMDGDTYVFVEVKARRNEAFGPPQSAVTPFKQRQISKAALTWLSKNRLHHADARFDVVALVVRENDVPQINHIVNAFDLAY